MQVTFAEYTARTAFERPLLSGVAYAQRVMNSERKRFEKQQGWTIRTMKREPSTEQDEYAPVIFSQETVSYIESLDMMSGEVNVIQSFTSGKVWLALGTSSYCGCTEFSFPFSYRRTERTF